jgi:hypothetical protein
VPPLVVLLAALWPALAIAGCGGDEEPAQTTPTLPELTIPRTETVAPTLPETQTAPVPPPAQTAPPGDDGGTPAPAPEPPPDSPENDVAPPPDSPAERFEEFCDENPGACG